MSWMEIAVCNPDVLRRNLHLNDLIQLKMKSFFWHYVLFVDLHGYPKFEKIDCTDSAYDLCYHVNYPNDGYDDDLLLKKRWENNPWSYTGYLKSEKEVKLSVLLPDPESIEDDEDREHTIVSPSTLNVAALLNFKYYYNTVNRSTKLHTILFTPNRSHSKAHMSVVVRNSGFLVQQEILNV